MRLSPWKSGPAAVAGVPAVLAVLSVAVPAHTAALDDKDRVVELFEDDTPAFIRILTGSTGTNAVARCELQDVYSGFHSLRVTPIQRFEPRIEGWNFPIVENPGRGQYRYIRFAWKKIGGEGIMLQVCHAGSDWEGRRYVAGDNVVKWAAKIVAAKPPAEWTVVTRDLFNDFGVMTLTGIAFTPMDGTAGLYDHVYLGRTVEDLDKIDRIGFGVDRLKEDLPGKTLLALWEELADTDDAKALRAQRALFAASRQSVPLFKERLRPIDQSAEEKEVVRLIAELDNDDFTKREAATGKLEKLGSAAVPAVRRALEGSPSLEARRRLERVLNTADKGDVRLPPEQVRALRAIRVLECVGGAEARAMLAILAKGTADSEVTRAAKAAAGRLSKASK